MCTGSFVENGRPPLGTKCAKPCVQQSGRWGWSWCYTKQDESQWGAECVDCPGTYISASYAIELVFLVGVSILSFISYKNSLL